MKSYAYVLRRCSSPQNMWPWSLRRAIKSMSELTNTVVAETLLEQLLEVYIASAVVWLCCETYIEGMLRLAV